MQDGGGGQHTVNSWIMKPGGQSSKEIKMERPSGTDHRVTCVSSTGIRFGVLDGRL